MDGVIVIDKIRGVTSHDVVAEVRKISGQARVGHFGTLDPLATGVLPVAVGRATRLQQFYLRSRKIYSGTIRFGFSTTTYDVEGEPNSEMRSVELSLRDLEQARKPFIGTIRQTPPAFSAKKIRGVSSHRLARKSQPVKLAPIQVEIFRFDLSLISPSEAMFGVECSGGTYVRSLAHEMGKNLGCGAHLTSLRRVASGEFTLERAVDFDLFRNEDRATLPSGWWAQYLIPLNQLLPWMPAVPVRNENLEGARNGVPFQIDGGKVAAAIASAAPGRDQHLVRLFSEEEEMIGIGLVDPCRATEEQLWVKPKIVFSRA